MKQTFFELVCLIYTFEVVPSVSRAIKKRSYFNGTYTKIKTNTVSFQPLLVIFSE